MTQCDCKPRLAKPCFTRQVLCPAPRLLIASTKHGKNYEATKRPDCRSRGLQFAHHQASHGGAIFCVVFQANFLDVLLWDLQSCLHIACTIKMQYCSATKFAMSLQAMQNDRERNTNTLYVLSDKLWGLVNLIECIIKVY